MLDSGTSFHITSHKEIMANYVANDFGKIYLADGQSLDVVGIEMLVSSNQTVLFGYRKSDTFSN